jgi:intracellular septation protein
MDPTPPAGHRAHPPVPFALKVLIEAGPILLFVVAYFTAGIYAATALLLIACLAALAASRRLEGRFPPMTLFTVGVSVLLGVLTLTMRDPLFIQLKPTIVFAVFTLGLLGSQALGGAPLMERMFGRVLPAPRGVWRRINLVYGLYFLGHAIANWYVAKHWSLSAWVIFKVFVFGGMSALLGLASVLVLRRQGARTTAASGPGHSLR